MFYYISFLRPPPAQAAPSGSIQLTPQIANDLRTESYTEAYDIYYSWTPCQDNHSTPSTSLILTKPVKLTTWRPSNAYKEIPVPVPPGVREGQKWQLLLSGHDQQPNLAVELHESDFGRLPLPVLSMPILFTSKRSKGNVKKQERIERIYRLASSNGSPVASGSEILSARELKITEQTSFDLDKKIWDSGIGLSSWLVDFQRDSKQDEHNPAQKGLWDALFAGGPRNIIELGAGTGMVALTIASLRAQSILPDGYNDNILATDLDTAIPLLEHNISSNIHLYSNNTPKADVLDWEQELPESIVSLERLDAIVMSDVTYNTTSFPALLNTISRLLKLVDKPPVILLGYKQRDIAERDLWSMMDDIGVHMVKIGERNGAGDPAVEIWFAQPS